MSIYFHLKLFLKIFILKLATTNQSYLRWYGTSGDINVDYSTIKLKNFHRFRIFIFNPKLRLKTFLKGKNLLKSLARYRSVVNPL